MATLQYFDSETSKKEQIFSEFVGYFLKILIFKTKVSQKFFLVGCFDMLKLFF